MYIGGLYVLKFTEYILEEAELANLYEILVRNYTWNLRGIGLLA